MEIISMISQSMKSVSMKSVSMAGKTDRELYEGYPLEVSAKAKKTASAYTIFGNTNSSAKGVGTEIKNTATDYTTLSNWVVNGGSSVEVVGNKVKITFGANNSSNAVALKCGGLVSGVSYLVHFDNLANIPLTAVKLGSPSAVGGGGATQNNNKIFTMAVTYANGAMWLWPSSADALVGEFCNFDIIPMTDFSEVSSYSAFLSRLGVSSLPYLPFGSTYHIGVVDTVNTPNFSAKKSALFLTQPLNKIGELVDSVDNKGKEYHPLKVVDMGSFTYEKKTHASGRVYFIFTPTDRDSGSGKTANTILQCGSYTSASSFYIADCPDDCVGCNGSNKICWVIDADFTDKTADEVKTLLTGTKLVYALATPTTATAVSVGNIGVQKGDNVITADTEVKPTKIKAKI